MELIETPQYIGIIYWANNTEVLDNTSVNQDLRKVWRECCKAHPIHSGRIVVRKEEYDSNGDLSGEVVKSFDTVSDCIEQYDREFNK